MSHGLASLDSLEARGAASWVGTAGKETLTSLCGKILGGVNDRPCWLNNGFERGVDRLTGF